jgi:hypothetical protein
MKKQTIGKQKALKDLQDYYEYANNSAVRQQWLNQYLINLSFYRGNQWLDPNILKDMQDIGATPYTYNNIEPLVNTFVSLQIRSSKRVGYEASSDNPEHVKLAEYLKHLAYEIQTQNDYVYFSSQKFTSSLIGGIGWSYFTYKNDKFCYEYIDPIEVLWDPDDRSARLDDSNFVCRVHYVQALKLKNQYPEHAKEFEQMVEENSTNPSDYTAYNTVSESSFWNQFGSGSNTVGNPQDDGAWVRGRSIKIVEVFYKKSAKYYETTVIFPEDSTGNAIPNEQLFNTFDESIAKDKSVNGEIVIKDGTQIWHGVFCDNLLIENNPIAEQIPNQKYLPLTPVVLKRDYQGLPYGVIDNLISPQKTHNFLWSTTLHYLDAKTIIASDEQVDKDKLREFLKDEMRSKNGVAFVKNPRELQVLDHEKNLNHRMNLIQANYKEFETQTGLYDELKGEKTNAISGVAIAQRANNSMNAQNALILAYENMIISEGKLMLDTIKGLNNFQYSFKFFANGRNQSATLDDSISLLNFEVYPDVSPNFSSTIEEEKARFAELMNSPNPALLMSSPLFLRELGFRENIAYELSEEYLRIMGLMQPQEQQTAEQNEQENEVTQ